MKIIICILCFGLASIGVFSQKMDKDLAGERLEYDHNSLIYLDQKQDFGFAGTHLSDRDRGRENNITHKMLNSGSNLAFVNQIGNNNCINMNHYGKQNLLIADQQGTSNFIAQLVDYSENNRSMVYQVGNMNESNISVSGNYNEIVVDMEGENNRISNPYGEFLIDGERIQTNLNQIGKNNEIISSQNGELQRTMINQYGNCNNLTFDQSPLDDLNALNIFYFNQFGNDNTMNVLHGGQNNQLNVDQSGNYNNLDIEISSLCLNAVISQSGVNNFLWHRSLASNMELEILQEGMSNTLIYNGTGNEVHPCNITQVGVGMKVIIENFKVGKNFN